jgi:hypothetical protein
MRGRSRRMLASWVVGVHLCSRASPVVTGLVDVYATAFANACRTWKLRSAREPNRTPTARDARLFAASPARRGGEAAPFARWAIDSDEP